MTNLVSVFPIKFSTTPIGHMLVREPMFVNSQGKLVDPIWRDINYFQEIHGMEFRQVVTIESPDKYEPPQYAGIFVGGEYDNVE
jgi:hypothetical protein